MLDPVAALARRPGVAVRTPCAEGEACDMCPGAPAFSALVGPPPERCDCAHYGGDSYPASAQHLMPMGVRRPRFRINAVVTHST